MTKRSKKRKKKKGIYTLLIIIVLIILCFFLYYFYVCKKGVKYKSFLTIEIGEKLPSVEDYVSNDDLDRVAKEIVWENLKTDDNQIYKTGEYSGTIGFNNEVLNIKLIIKDTTPPVIEGCKDIEIIAYEEKPDLISGIIVTDNSGENIEATINGEYDFEEVGEYALSYSAKDSSNNETIKNFKLIVKENKNVKISKTSKGNKIKNYYGITYIDDVIVVNKTYSLPSNFAPNNLSTINGYIKTVDYVKDAFNELTSDSKSIGLNIYASSGYRSYSDQKYIYNNYVRLDGKENADTYSARAGHSEHQTGLAIDVNTVNASFNNTDESNWLKDNCYKYGFIIRYPERKESITGYTYEPWHIRYVGKDLATILYNKGSWITMEEYFGIDSKYS